jgi:proline iminopeptidase
LPEFTVTSANGNLWVTSQGRGPPIVLCPGGPGLCDYLGPVAALLDDVATVYRFDPRGCGRSGVAGPYDVAALVADLEAIRRNLGVERWTVGGHSAGANLALTYGLTHPERTTAVIAISSPGFQDDRSWHEAYHAGVDAGRDPVPDFAFPPNMEVNREANASWKEYARRPTLCRDLTALPVPTLFVSGSEDVRPSWPAEQIANVLPNGRFVSISGAAHCQWLTHADELRAVIRGFLSQEVLGESTGLPSR